MASATALTPGLNLGIGGLVGASWLPLGLEVDHKSWKVVVWGQLRRFYAGEGL